MYCICLVHPLHTYLFSPSCQVAQLQRQRWLQFRDALFRNSVRIEIWTIPIHLCKNISFVNVVYSYKQKTLAGAIKTKKLDFQTMGWRYSARPLKIKVGPETLVFFNVFLLPPVHKHWFYQRLWLPPLQKHCVFQCFLLLSLKNIGKTNVVCSFSNYDVASPAHSLELMFFWCYWCLLALPMFSAPKAEKHWKNQGCLLLCKL